MYQFTTTTVINSNLDSNGVTPKFAGSATGFNVTRVNFFKKDNIESIFKTPYAAGVKEVASVTLGAATSGKVVRLSVEVRLAQQNADSEYANAYLWFRKPVVVEVISSGVAATDAAALVAQLNGLKDRFGSKYFNASVVGATITLTALEDNQRFYSVKFEQELASPNSIIEMEYAPVAGTTFAVTTPGKAGFGNDAHMIKSVMIPTYENTRFFGTNKEERPVIGGNYSQYTIRYSVDKHIDDGISSGGKSITTHVFWVKSDLVEAFDEALITDATLTVKDSVTGDEIVLVP